MHIVGTAGHVDHGKSSLVAALTGTNPDRWIEEQMRGMTLDLGFAHLRFEDGSEAGIVDVPGHERFLHNMLAGASGMELLLLVVAADEGVMPQTLEHLQILRFLNVQRTIVVVTKADLLSAGELDLAIASIAESLRQTSAAGSPLLAVSSVTGAGLDGLRAAMLEALRHLPVREPDSPAYLPIDRVFALPGRGTIVTGTLMQGTLAVGDRVKLEPSGKNLRIRSLHVFGDARAKATAGSRVAVNLPGIEVREIARGEMLANPQFEPSDAFAVRFRALPDSAALLRRSNPVRAYIGSAEILGTLVLEGPAATDAFAPARLFLKRATIAYPGTAFVLRRLSPKTLLGGGRIEAAGTREREDASERSDTRDPRETAVLAALRAHALDACAPADIAREINLREDAVAPILETLAVAGEALRVSRPAAYVDGEAAEAFLAHVVDTLHASQRAEPWAMGMTSVALSRATGVAEPLTVRISSAYAQAGRLAHRAGYYCTTDHTPKLNAELRDFFDRNVPLRPDGALLPSELAEVVTAVKLSRVPGIAKAFDTLVVRGALVKVGDSLYRGTQIAEAHAKVEAFLREEQQMTMAQFRDLIGTSRKYAVPLLEWFDARGITVRSGDVRVLRARKT